MFIPQPRALRKAPGNSQFKPYITRLAPSSAGQGCVHPSQHFSPFVWAAPGSLASWGLKGELTLAPHLGFTSLCAEVTSRGLPGDDIIPQFLSDVQKPLPPQVGEVSRFKEESHWARKGS